MEKEEIEKAAARLGLEKDVLKSRLMKGTGILTILLAVLLAVLLLIHFLRSISTYPHIRSPSLPKNRFLVALAFVVEKTTVEYGVFSRAQFLQQATG